MKDNCLLYNPAKSLIQQFSVNNRLALSHLESLWFSELPGASTITTGSISTSHFKLQEAPMSQGNHFLFIYFQMPSRVRIQPAFLRSQKPRGSSQLALDVTACSCLGRLLARRSRCSYWAAQSEGNHGVRKSLPCSSENWRCYLWGWTCSVLSSLSPNTHRWFLSKVDAVPIRALGWPCTAIHAVGGRHCRMPYPRSCHQSQGLD